MSAECGGPAETGPSQERGHDRHSAKRLWQVRELQFAAAAALLLAAGWLVGRTGAGQIGLWVELAAAVVGAATFVPEAVRNVLRRRVGIGTLMTIAAVGAVALGQFAEAALLGGCSRSPKGWSTTRSPAPAAGCDRCWGWYRPPPPSYATAWKTKSPPMISSLVIACCCAPVNARPPTA